MNYHFMNEDIFKGNLSVKIIAWVLIAAFLIGGYFWFYYKLILPKNERLKLEKQSREQTIDYKQWQLKYILLDACLNEAKKASSERISKNCQKKADSDNNFLCSPEFAKLDMEIKEKDGENCRSKYSQN